MSDSSGAGPVVESEAQLPATGKQMVTVHLQNIPLLSGLDSSILSQVGMSMLFRKVEKGCHILHKGGSGDHLLFLLAGRLRVVDLTEDGREIGLSVLLPGDYFGELSVIDEQPRSASVVATEPSLIALLPATQAANLIFSHPQVAKRVMQRLTQKIRSDSNHRAILGIPSARRRVYALLEQFMTVAPGGLTVIENIPPQQEIAIMANTSRETVSRALQVLVQQGVVEKDLRRLIVRQPEQLKSMILEQDDNGD